MYRNMCCMSSKTSSDSRGMYRNMCCISSKTSSDSRGMYCNMCCISSKNSSDSRGMYHNMCCISSKTSSDSQGIYQSKIRHLIFLTKKHQTMCKNILLINMKLKNIKILPLLSKTGFESKNCKLNLCAPKSLLIYC